MHVLVAGCGWLGSAVGAALLERGDRITCVRRTPTLAATLRRPDAGVLAIDLADADAVGQIAGPLDAVVMCAAAGADSPEAYHRAYVDVNRNLLAAAERLGVRSYVYTGSTGVFGQQDGSDVDETTPPAPAHAGAEVLVLAEAIVRAAVPTIGAKVLRLSGLYGPDRAWPVAALRAGRLALGPGDDAWTNWCHRDDAVAAVLAALDRGTPGGVYHATDAEPARRRDVVRWLAGRLRIEPPVAAAGAAPRRGAHRRIHGEWTRRQLGLALRYPTFRDGLAALLPPLQEV